MTIHGSVTGVVNIHTQRTWEKIHTRMQRCARSSCPFASTWHSTHCCASCERSGLHGPHCERLQFGAPDAQRPNDAQKTLPSGSTVQEHFLLGDRSYLLHLPPLAVCAASPPASHVFCFHGAGGRPDHHVNEWEPLVAAGAVVGVYPRGFNGGWALGNVPLQPSEDLEVAAAVKFVEAVLADVEAQLPAAFTAPGRPLRFAHGFSNGAGLVQLLACVRPSLFVAASAFATQMREGQRPMGDSRIALLQVSGMADEVIPYEGGRSRVGAIFMRAEDSASLWADFNGCVAPTTKRSASGVLHTWEAGVPGGPRVVHLGLADVGHGIPSIASRWDDYELGATKATGGLLGLVWEFFRAAAPPGALAAFPVRERSV